jgi:hypothetical protein
MTKFRSLTVQKLIKLTHKHVRMVLSVFLESQNIQVLDKFEHIFEQNVLKITKMTGIFGPFRKFHLFRFYVFAKVSDFKITVHILVQFWTSRERKVLKTETAEKFFLHALH